MKSIRDEVEKLCKVFVDYGLLISSREIKEQFSQHTTNGIVLSAATRTTITIEVISHDYK